MPGIDSIRAYYNRNTQLFLRFGSSGKAQVIHRALWFAGVTDLVQALNAANELILAEARRFVEPIRLLDLGCGVGATLVYLLEQLAGSARGFGLTISALQARLGGALMADRNLPGFVLEADFQHVPLASGFDLAFAVEAFVHVLEPEQFLAEVARVLRPAHVGAAGGRLVLIDDFLGEPGGARPGTNWLDLYQRGWHALNLVRPAELFSLASRHGLILVENRLLTPDLRLRALPDVLVKLLAALFSPFWNLHPIVPSMLGSIALQQCLRDGGVEYRCLVFERDEGRLAK
jgi:SAM-dependent methyltransferase